MMVRDMKPVRLAGMCVRSWLLLPMAVLILASPTSAQCPSDDCSCESRAGNIIINCRRYGLTAVPTFSPTSTAFTELTLYGNRITALPANAFRTTQNQPLSIKKLDLGNNMITAIDNEAFSGLASSLEELILHVNQINVFPLQALNSLTKLKSLTIEGFNTPQLPTSAFSSFAQLEVLHIEGCKLSGITRDHFTNQRNVLRQLHLPRNELTSIPLSALVDLSALTKLDLSSNFIATLPSKGFSGVDSLQDLVLTQNGFNSVMPDAFAGLERTLAKLSLSFTDYHDSMLESLEQLSNLEVLDLSNNKNIKVPTFRGLDRLKVLNLHGCRVSRVTDSMFEEVGDTVEEIDLVGNTMTHISTGTFTPMTALKKLELEGNPLHNFLSSGNPFAGLEDTLEFLSLAGTQITILGMNSVKNLRKLKTLKLYSNQINSIPIDIFLQLNELEILELNNNQIQDVTQQGLRGLHKSLKEINLGNNQISTLNECVFFEFQQLATVKLDNNPINCDCRIRWLRDSNREVDGECVSPPSVSEEDIMDVAPADFTCDSPPPAVECEVYTTPALPSITTIPSTTLGPLEMVLVNVTEATSESLTVVWSITESPQITGFKLEVEIMGGELVQEQEAGPELRGLTVYGLRATTRYLVCVSVDTVSADLWQRGCVEAITDAAASTGEEDQLALILGCVIGVLGFVIFLTVVILCIRRCHRNRLYANTKLPTHANAPTMGYNSRRFSKPKSDSLQNMSSQDLEKKLEGFTPAERNRILNLLTTSGASTLSMISHASSNRYLDEPLPHSQYLHQGDREYGTYQEIPADQLQYEYIPADQIGKYDYIPADQVSRVEQPVPPTPVPRPAGGVPPLWPDMAAPDPAATVVRSKSDANLAENGQAENWI